MLAMEARTVENEAHRKDTFVSYRSNCLRCLIRAGSFVNSVIKLGIVEIFLKKDVKFSECRNNQGRKEWCPV